MSKKVIISKEGYDATSETDPDNLIFSSDYGTLKYYLNGNASIRIVGDGSDQSSTTTINHALGYVPVFLVYVNGFVNDASDYYLTPYYSSTAVVAREATAYATTSNLYLKMRNKSSSTYTANFYYKIFRNSVGL